MKPAQPLRALGAAPQNDITEALVNALAERVAAHVIERIGNAAPQGPAEGQQLLDRTGLALALGVSLSTIDRLIAKGCPFVWVLDSRRFEFEKVKAWLYHRTG